MRTELLLGPPGTGKTEALLGRLTTFLENGQGAPEEVAFVAFTRRAATEARERVGAGDWPYMRTLHSLAFQQLRLKTHQVMGREAWEQFGRWTGLEFTARDSLDEDPLPEGAALGDQLVRLVGLARSRELSVTEQWELDPGDLPLSEVLRFSQDLERFKAREGLFDYHDLLDRAMKPLPVKLFLVDEAQDLTRQQWAFARRMAAVAEHCVLAGDDDQAIYEWAGADPDHLLRLRCKREVLQQSYRLPRRVWELGQNVIGGVAQRIPKQWRPRDELGRVEFIASLEELDLFQGTWLLLCRHRNQLSRLEEHCRRAGVVYRLHKGWSNEHPEVRAVVLYERWRKGVILTSAEAERVTRYVLGLEGWRAAGDTRYESVPWPIGGRPDWMIQLTRLAPDSREYIRSLRVAGEPLTGPGRVRLSTIHGAKGAQADNVLVVDGFNRRVASAFEANPAAELRVWYVAVTRARNSLFILRNRQGGIFLI